MHFCSFQPKKKKIWIVFVAYSNQEITYVCLCRMIHFSMSKEKKSFKYNCPRCEDKVREQSTTRRKRSVKKPAGSSFGKQELQRMRCEGRIVAKHWRHVLCMHIYIFCVPVWNQHCVSVGEELKVHACEMFAKDSRQQAVKVTISALNGANFIHFNPKLKAHFIAVHSRPSAAVLSILVHFFS